MADADEKEKAEKLAAAKKRFEELKKQKQKQTAKKGTTKKKDEKVDDVASSKKDDHVQEKPDEAAAEPIEEPDTNGTAEEEGGKAADLKTPKPTRTPSLSLQSRERSESFRKATAVGGGLKSPTLPTVDAGEEAQEVYRKQAAKIAELESQVATLDETKTKLAAAEEQLDTLRESNADTAALKDKADAADEHIVEIEKLKTELATAQRQLLQAQQQAATKNRRQSTANASTDFTSQLASKTSTIESLELELSNLRYQVSLAESEKSTQENAVKAAGERAAAAEKKISTLEDEVQSLRSQSSNANEPPTTSGTASDTLALQSRLSALESDLRTAQASLSAATNKSTNLETKIETLTKLHRESSTQHAASQKEVKDLKSRLKNAQAARVDAAGEDLSDLEEEEREKLQSRIRDLEAENFELRRGVWRDARAKMQPGMEDGYGDVTSPGYEDVDLSSAGNEPYAGRSGLGGGVRQSSTFTDVLQSGISAFTGRENPRSAGSVGVRRESDQYGGQRQQSLGLLSEEGFDEDAFRLAQEDEVKARLERVKEVKRGLEKWRGWRLDLVDVRQAGLPGVVTGPVFEV